MYRVFNFGSTVEIPYKNGTLQILPNDGFTIEDPELIAALRRAPRISIKEIVEEEEVESPGSSDAIAEGQNTKELLKEAAAKGLKNFFGLSKERLRHLLAGSR